MTPQERKVMKLALETLESSRIFVTSREKIKHPEGTDWYDERITAIEAALAQPEQEPVAWMNDMGTHIDLNVSGRGIPLYTTPPQRKPLTDEQIDAIADEYLVDYRIPAGCAWNFARDIEAAHGIKE